MFKLSDLHLNARLPSYGLCTFITSFLSVRSTATAGEGNCSSSKPIYTGVPQGSVLLPSRMLLLINGLSLT